MKKFLKGFTYAFEGIAATVKSECNMRFHLVMAAYMAFFLVCFDYFQVTRTEAAILFLTCALVIALELLNTAVEAGLDAVCRGPNPMVKLAKDASAGAVLVAGLGAVGVGIAILYQPPAFRLLVAYYKSHVGMLVLLALSLVLALLFIFKFGDSKMAQHFSKRTVRTRQKDRDGK